MIFVPFGLCVSCCNVWCIYVSIHVWTESRTDGPRVDCTEFDAATTVIKASQQPLFVVDQASQPESCSVFPDSRRRRQQIAVMVWRLAELAAAVALPPLHTVLPIQLSLYCSHMVLCVLAIGEGVESVRLGGGVNVACLVNVERTRRSRY